MAGETRHFDEAELEAIVARLRREVQASSGEDLGGDAGGSPAELRTRRQLDQIWAVTAERPYLYRPGWWGRMRGTLLLPPKSIIRRLVRWYVEPLAIDQRAFNAGVLRLADELTARLSRLERSVGSLEERLARLEQPTERAPARGE